jgi:hypothetical protein
MVRASLAVLALCACTTKNPASEPAAVCPTAGDVTLTLNAAPHALASSCTDASPPTLTLSVAWSADGSATANGSGYRNVQCADGSIAYQGCAPSDRPVPVEWLSQGPCPPECTVTL